jgi:hypothetical protein
MKTLFVGIVGIAVGSSFSVLLMQSTRTSSAAPCECKCSCPLDSSPTYDGSTGAPAVDTFEEAVRAATSPPHPKWDFPGSPLAEQQHQHHNAAAAATAPHVQCPPVPACPTQESSHEASAHKPLRFESSETFVPPAPVDLEESEAALSKWHDGKWGGAGEGRARALCYVNNNLKLLDQVMKLTPTIITTNCLD